MPDETTPPTPPPSGQPSANPIIKPQATKAPAASAPNAGHIPITEEMDSAKWTLPPIVPLLVAAVLVAIVVSVVVFSNKTKPSASLAITKVASAAQEGNTMVAIQIKLDNQVEGPLWIKEIKAEVETADGKKYTDSAAPGVDAPRYMEAFPPLAEAKADWLREDLKIPTKTSFNGVAIFSYPVAKAAFDKRKQVTLRIQLYDRPALVATNSPAPAP
jgi:hypothetical protein